MSDMPILRSTIEGSSFFSFISDYCKDEQSGISLNRCCHRLCTLMRKMGGKSVVIYPLDPALGETAEERNALNTYFGTEIPVESHRFVFLSEEITDIQALKGVREDNFLADTVLINFQRPSQQFPVWSTYLYSAIVACPTVGDPSHCQRLPLLNNYVHVRNEFKRFIPIANGEERSVAIKGIFFCQQNTFTNVCAHSVLKMAINNFRSNSEMVTSEAINTIIGIDHINQKLKYNDRGGLSPQEMLTVCDHYGLSYVDIAFSDPDTYADSIYKYVESRFPIILGFSTKGGSKHVVSVMGHTLNTDMWRPEAEPVYTIEDNRYDLFKSASEWVDHFVINDDNFGMYLCMPVDSLKHKSSEEKKTDEESGLNAFNATMAIILTPRDDITTPAYEVEWASRVIIDRILNFLEVNNIEFDPWFKRIIASLNATPPRPLVFRTFLIGKDEYSSGLELSDFEGQKFSREDITKLTIDLPDFFWLCEMTLPDLYTANKTKIIDFYYGCNYPIIKDVDKAIEELENRWIQIRFPGALFKQTGGKLSSETLSVNSHYPIFRFEGEDSLNW